MLFTGPAQNNQIWVQVEVKIPESFNTFSVVFEGSSTFGLNNPRLGVDDVSLRTGACRKYPGDCDFETGFCSWSNVNNDDFDWLLHKGETPSWDTGPTVDHTLNTANGTYVYIETSYPQKFNDKALLVSESFTPDSTNSICFGFWYHAYGSSVGTLRVYLADTNYTKKYVLWELSGKQSKDQKDWKQGVVPVTGLNDDYTIIFEGVVGKSYDGDISIDDITFTPFSNACYRMPDISLPTTTTSPPPTTTGLVYDGFLCDFEKDSCGWIQAAGSTVNWKRKTGLSGYGGPKYDHTFNSNSSYYIYFETGFSKAVSRLMSPRVDGNLKQCFEFWYHMYGDDVGRLSVYYLVDNGSGSLQLTNNAVWMKKDNHGDHWQFAQVQYEGGNSSVAHFVLEGLTGYYYDGQIAVDDIGFKYGDCEAADFVSVSCDFEEEHICGYESDPKTEFNWARHQGKTFSSNTGPSVDVTTGTGDGYYMYIETSYPQYYGDRARIISPIQNYTTGKCLYFWYHAYGRDVGLLNVYSELQTNQTVKQRNLLWTLTGNQGDTWYIARVPTEYSVDFKILFEGIVGKSYLGDVAIDDVFMSPESCQSPPDCDFENPKFEFCSWLNFQNTTNDYNWLIFSDYSMPQFGAIADNTLQTVDGHFMVAIGKTQDLYSNQRARLFSEILPATSENGICLTFYYYFNGYTGSNLTVRLSEFAKPLQTIWNFADKQETNVGNWKLGQVAFEATSIYRIYLDAFAGSDSKNFIGVDDIEFATGSSVCRTIPLSAGPIDYTTRTTTSTTRATPSMYSEFDCDFESQCSWRNSPTNSFFNWIVQSAQSSSSFLFAAQKDHTLNTELGSYAGVFATNFTKNAKGGFISPQMNGTRCVEFWYYMYGSEVSILCNLKSRYL